MRLTEVPNVIAGRAKTLGPRTQTNPEEQRTRDQRAMELSIAQARQVASTAESLTPAPVPADPLHALSTVIVKRSGVAKKVDVG